LADFFQNGLITTLHDLRSADPGHLEDLLVRATKRRPLALILPVTASDMRAAAFENILKELADAEFLDEIVVVLGLAPTVADFQECLTLVRSLGSKAHVVWCDGPRITEIYDQLTRDGIYVGPNGKGRSVWTAIGFLQANPALEAYALHDCDIVTYSRELLVRLCLPIAHPHFDFDFVKAYYARFTDQLHGRVVRLLVTPLVRSLMQCLEPNRFLQYVDSFRYPLSGEFSIAADLAAVNRVPGDWGLEVGTLAEVFRNVSIKRVCQVDICPQYEHKHQATSLDDPQVGLSRMAHDIISNLFRTLMAMGTTLQREHVMTIRAAYLRNAQDAIRQYGADAEMNGLRLDRHTEEMICEAFAKTILPAAERIEHDPIGSGELPNWVRVTSAYPDMPDRLRSAVREDRLEHENS
jgi:glucosyl-3-phosphoglycerate synthase